MESKNQKSAPRVALGRGLSALISTAPISVEVAREKVANVVSFPGKAEPERVSGGGPSESEVTLLSIDRIVANPHQPRQDFAQDELVELSQSIKSLGVLQPVVVRTKHEGLFEIVAGERRWRAAVLAGLKQLPVLIRDLDDRQCLEIALVENVQREDLNPMELCGAYQRLMDEFALSQQDVAERVGRDRASVANYARLSKLAPEVQEMISSNHLSFGHAKALLGIKETSAQLSLAKKTAKEQLSVRELEALVAKVAVLDTGHRIAGARGGLAGSQRSVAFPEVVDRLRAALGTKVSIRHHRSGRGKVEIEYFSEQELDRIVDHLCR